MKIKKAEKIINYILKNNSIEAGIFITLLSKAYLDTFDLSKKDFLIKLEKSIEVLEREEK